MGRTLHDQGTLIAQLQYQLAGLNRDVQRPLTDFHNIVMDPNAGLVVSVRHLERDFQIHSKEFAKLMGQFAALLEENLALRVLALEEQRKQSIEDRRYGVRDILIPALVSIAVGLGLGILTRGWP